MDSASVVCVWRQFWLGFAPCVGEASTSVSRFSGLSGLVKVFGVGEQMQQYEVVGGSFVDECFEVLFRVPRGLFAAV